MTSDARPLVLHVIHHLLMGGMENGVVNLINNMPASRFRHAIACIEDYSDFRKRIERPDVDVIALHRSQIGVWQLRREILRLCRRLRPAIVHSRNLSGLDAIVPARLAGVAHCVQSEHGFDVNDLKGEHWKPALLRRLHSPFVERYITVSKDLQRMLVERVGINAARISQIYNGVDTGRFAPAGEKTLNGLPAAFQGEDLLLIGTVGRFQRVKDQATLLRAFSALLTDQPELRERLRLLVVGDGPLMDELRQLADSLGIAALTWFPGALNTIPDVLRTLDVFVLPSLNEGISNTILEAMASGLPVVATQVGGNVELIEDGRCGRFFTPGDSAALSAILGAYATDTPMRQTHSRAARQIAEQRFSLSAMMERYTAVYEGLCHRK